MKRKKPRRRPALSASSPQSQFVQSCSSKASEPEPYHRDAEKLVVRRRGDLRQGQEAGKKKKAKKEEAEDAMDEVDAAMGRIALVQEQIGGVGSTSTTCCRRSWTS